MNSTVEIPTSRCRVGLSRVDITPPVGIYHRFWGAAKHDQATGVHRPLTATVLLIAPFAAQPASTPHVLIAIDHCLFRAPEMNELLERLSQLIGVDVSHITCCFSHTHSGGNLSRLRYKLPGGDLIGPYLDELPGRLATAHADAQAMLQPAVLTYANTTCRMAHQRNFWDADSEQYVCGYNPADAEIYPVTGVRIANADGQQLASIVHYPCHPTTLAWENTLISPDYVGALRETVEAAKDGPCLFLLGACGDVGPRNGFVGGTRIADNNGRQVAYAALSALESLPATSGVDVHYAGAVLSGATLGVWENQPHAEARVAQTTVFRYQDWVVDLPYREGVPTAATVTNELEELLSQELSALSRGDADEAQRLRALAERKRRIFEQVSPLPPSATYPFRLQAWQLGDAFWVAVEGEPYYTIQQELERHFAPRPVIVIPLANGSRCGYLPTREDYEKSIYQVNIAILAPGSLETLTASIIEHLETWRTT